MRTGVRDHRQSTRVGERIALQSRLVLRSEAGDALTADATCLDIGLGGLRGHASCPVVPGSRVMLELRLPTGRCFASRGRVVWCRTTCHPEILGSPRGIGEDACFGIAFDEVSTQDLLPIARLLVARADERRRARRIRRLHGLTIPA